MSGKSVCTRLKHSATNGLPLGAEGNPRLFKMMMVDMGISTAQLGLSKLEYRFSPKETYPLNPGDLIAIYPNHPFLLTGDSYHYQFVSFDGEGSEHFLNHIGLPPKSRTQKKTSHPRSNPDEPDDQGRH